MPLIEYTPKTFAPKSLALIESANAIIDKYRGQGYLLTLRQLYYQFVARDILPNSQQNYKRLGSIINDARLAGLVDWSAIEDRTRNLEGNSHWDTPSDIIDSCVNSFRLDLWEGQEYRPEVWCEKEALIGVFERICRKLDIDFFACRGYVSQSEMWSAARRMQRTSQRRVILHFGDHDPSGIDMTRDIIDRLELFGAGVVVERLALNMDQVDEYQPPPNPAKLSDSRCDGYMREFGDESWELDALDPDTLSSLVQDAVNRFRDDAIYSKRLDLQQQYCEDLEEMRDDWRKAH